MPRTPAASPPATTADAPSPRTRSASASPAMGLAVADAGVLLLFLGLTFLLGIFPQHDTDFWWHLRTGDLIRQGAGFPLTDWYTFGASDHTWIDLHWGFQVALSLLYAAGGVNATIAAKCVVTTLAVGLLVTARRRTWPLWVMTLSWIPALLLLGGRMYVRPETMTLLYIAADLAILTRIDRHPRLAWALPVVQVFWVNTQGLFAFGPIFVGMALIDAVFRRGAFAPERRAWWRTVLSASLATGLACVLNPYGLMGALYPLQLVGTMSNPVFKDIGELTSIREFIERNGLVRSMGNGMLQLHFGTMLLGALSFLFPIVWWIDDRMARRDLDESSSPKQKRKQAKKPKPPEEPLWRLSPFRLMLYVSFSLLSLKATRNSHQFAAIVGAVTAWNFGEWSAAIAKRRAQARTKPDLSAAPLIPRLAASVVLAAMILLVGSGGFYAWTKEGRKVAWGEAPLWFAHDAMKFAGSEGMPSRFLTFHDGLAGLFEYHNGPKQKVYTDARLEVMGPEVFAQDKALAKAISTQTRGWVERIEALGSPIPGVVIDHVQDGTYAMAVAFLGDDSWRCVWYDPTASVYLHTGAANDRKPVDFAARHFGRDLTSEPVGAEALGHSARVLSLHARGLMGHLQKLDTAAAMATLGANYARRSLAIDPTAEKTWRALGIMEALSIKGVVQLGEPRFRMPLDPVIDLPFFRATHDLAQAVAYGPEDFEAIAFLFNLYSNREMHEAANAIGDRLLDLPTSPEISARLQEMTDRVARARAAVVRPPKVAWANAGELDRVVSTLYAEGRAETAADLLESAYQPRERTWEQADRIATLRMHLGRPDLARAAWLSCATVPRPALRDARVAMTYLVQGEMDAARRHYFAATTTEPDLFEARIGLAVLERDTGNAKVALAAARSALRCAPTKSATSAAEDIIAFVQPYAETK
jgi:tetratricopeptide (TPR) repeat protein